MRSAETPRTRLVAVLLLGSLLAPGVPAGAHGSEPHVAQPPPTASPEPEPLFEPPPPGSYELPPIARVRDHLLLDERGLPARFPALEPGQVAVVSFVYGSCPSGCPLALATLQRLDRDVAGHEALAPRVRLVTVSFDPERDAPARMAEIRRHLAPRSRWSFLTGSDDASLVPVLDDYGQRVMRQVDPHGANTGVLDHVLKVYLVDDRLRIRNVYSAGLMDARLILNDIQTVLAD